MAPHERSIIWGLHFIKKYGLAYVKLFRKTRRPPPQSTRVPISPLNLSPLCQKKCLQLSDQRPSLSKRFPSPDNYLESMLLKKFSAPKNNAEQFCLASSNTVTIPSTLTIPQHSAVRRRPKSTVHRRPKSVMIWTSVRMHVMFAPKR